MFIEHPSFLRLFTPIELKELSPIEAHELITIFMREQRKRIEDEAKMSIASISRGYPVNMQLIGFYSYQIDTDNVITKQDVTKACDHIIENVKSKEFLSKHELVGYGLSEDILSYCVKEKGNLNFNALKKVLSTNSEKEIQDAIRVLVDGEIIYQTKKGEYFIKDQLFFKYLQSHYRK